MACHLRVGVLPIPLVADVTLADNGTQVTGITDILLSSVRKNLNCSYSYRLPSVLTYGTLAPNGTWNAGLMADIANNLVDMTFPSVPRGADEDALADPTPPIFTASIGILAGRTRIRDTSVTGYLLTFDIQVWALLLFFLALISTVFTFLDVASRRMRGENAVAAERWSQHFWMLFGNMLCEPSVVTPERTVLRVVSATWWLAIVVLMNAFTGHMRACLLVKSELEKINTLQDIAANPHLKVYLLKNTVVTSHLESSQGTAERKVWSMIRRDKTDLFGLLHYPEEMLREVLHEKAVIIHGRLLSQTEAGNFCSRGQMGEFYFGTESMYSLLFGAYMNRLMNVTLRKRIKRITTALMESGIVRQKYILAIPPLNRCHVVEEKEALALWDMISVFYVYFAFISASILVFTAEMIAGYIRRHADR